MSKRQQRQEKPGDRRVVLPIPMDKVGMVFGKQHTNRLRLEASYDVSVQVNQTNTAMQNGVQVCEGVITGQRPEDAAKDIQSMFDGKRVGGGGGGFGGGGFGGGGGFKGSGGGGMMGQAFVFRCCPKTRELQLLLVHSRGEFTVPKDRMTQPGDDANSYLQGIHRCLAAYSGAQDPPLASLPSVHPLNITKKIIYHLLQPVGGPWDQWQPGPKPEAAQALGLSDGALRIAGQSLPSTSGHVWASISVLMAGVKAMGHNVSKDVTIWFSKNAQLIVPEILTTYEQAFGPGCCRVSEVAAAAAAGSPAVPPNWASNPVGLKILENLKTMVDTLHGLDQAQFVQTAEKCFNPYHLHEAMKKWEALGGPLTTPSASIQL